MPPREKLPNRPPTPKQFFGAQKSFSKQFEVLRRAYFTQVGVFAINALEQAKGIPDDEERAGAIVGYVHAYVSGSPWANIEAQSYLILSFSRHTHAAAHRLPEGLVVPPEHGGPAISFQAMAIAAAVEDVLEAVSSLPGGLKLGKTDPEQLVRGPNDFWTIDAGVVASAKRRTARRANRPKRDPPTT